MSNLRVLREINNYTQEYVASQIGVDQSTYCKIERNPRVLKAEQVEKLAQLYDVGVADILAPSVSISFENTQKGYGYINNLNEEFQPEAFEKIIAAKDDQIKELKEQIEYLKKQNNQLLALLGEKR
ncbi:helix-turn-helix domain-containing protein [Ohtaekwangia kribbensis]|uniref:Helix-turn-helix domain-containing protein n=1 Tax=Ohtaekwangia kribbensis TaxID=688913 RepID=A0ABW3K6I8_9BACT